MRNETLLVRSVERLTAALARVERQAAAAAGVSVSQMRVVLHLERASDSGRRVSKLAEDQGLAVSTMTRNLALLERKGWVHRLPGREDRRTVRVRLSASGRELAVRLRNGSVARFSRAFSAFHPSDRVERAVALDRVAAALESSDEEG